MTWPLSWDPPAVLARTGECLVPSDLSWARARALAGAGLATTRRPAGATVGVLTLTAEGRAALRAAGEGARDA